MKSYPIAPNGIFETIQGEGALLGLPMVFVRLAGCSVGCAQCDTDYIVSGRMDAAAIARRVASIAHPNTGWVWITGGEPTDHDLLPLVWELRRIPGVKIALATAGHRKINAFSTPLRIDWLSVSPHDPAAWKVKGGSELKLVPGLNGFSLADFASEAMAISKRNCPLFSHFYVQPCDGLPETLRQCVEWVHANPEWRITPQAHKAWKLP